MLNSVLPSHPGPSISAAIKQRALKLGFDRVGIAPAERPLHADFYLDWLGRGLHGEMHYLSRPDAVERRLDPGAALPQARSIIVVALNYNLQDGGPVSDRSLPVIARYARGTDYHRIFEAKLEALTESLQELVGTQVAARFYVDYGPVLERDHAQRAGLGWIGKNTLLIDPEIGSYIFLGELLTDLELETDQPFQPDHCGTCDSCIVACPTGAITAPRELDARRCISYLTIELRGPIPRDLRPLIANRIFGCDICQEVCPWNRDLAETNEARFRAREDVTGSELVTLMSLNEEGFRARFAGTAISRAKRSGFLRNVAVALGNWGEPDALPALVTGLNDSEPLIRGHSAWSLGRIGGAKAQTALAERLDREDDDWVREEIGSALQSEPA
jgi:epoxyqueuosine reductase